MKKRYKLTVPGVGWWKFFADGIEDAEDTVLDLLEEDDDDREIYDEQPKDMRGDEMVKEWKESRE